MIFAGLLRSKGGGPEFTPLLRTSAARGTSSTSSEATQQSFIGVAPADPSRPPLRHGSFLHPRRPGPGEALGARQTEGPKKEEKTGAGEEARSPRHRDRRPRPDLRAVLRAAAAEDREPGARQRDVRAQLRRRPGRRRGVHPAAEAASRSTGRLQRLEKQTETYRQEPRGRDQGGRGGGRGTAEPRPEAVRQGSRGRPRRTDLDERTKEIKLAEPPGSRQPPARSREGEHRGPEAEEDPGEQGRDGADDPPDPEQRPDRRRSCSRPCLPCSWACSSSASASAARTWGPTRTGWPDRRLRSEGMDLWWDSVEMPSGWGRLQSAQFLAGMALGPTEVDPTRSMLLHFHRKTNMRPDFIHPSGTSRQFQG